MVFEVGDLAAASPATVSRCGMVYSQPSLLGWHALVDSWLDALHADMLNAVDLGGVGLPEEEALGYRRACILAFFKYSMLS